MDNGILIHMVGVIHMPLISSYTFMPGTAFSAAQRQGLTSGLKLCLDAGDINSYSGSGQKWLDTSGNGYDFFRGTSGSSESSDPTFNGTAGGQSSSEYWSFDGGDFFRYDTANETWMNNLHKNNALWSAALWVRLVNTTTEYPLFATMNAGMQHTGVMLSTNGFDGNDPGALFLNVYNGTQSFGLNIATTAEFTANTWSFAAITLDEAAGTCTLQINGTQEAKSGTYSNPSSGNASITMRLGSDEGNPAPAGSRMAQVWIWEGGALSTTQLTDLYNVTRSKFGV
jgi:hypothetical protein